MTRQDPATAGSCHMLLNLMMDTNASQSNDSHRAAGQTVPTQPERFPRAPATTDRDQEIECERCVTPFRSLVVLLVKQLQTQHHTIIRD